MLRSRGNVGVRSTRFGAAVITAGWPGRSAGWWGGWWLVSAGRGRERLEFLKRGDEFGRPRPCVLEVELRAAAGEREPASDVQQPVAQPFGLGLGQLPVEDERLGPDDQVVREQHDLQPHLVERELLERELRQAGVLVVTDPVLDVRVAGGDGIPGRRCPRRSGR
jgi:hypothetical protein